MTTKQLFQSGLLGISCFFAGANLAALTHTWVTPIGVGAALVLTVLCAARQARGGRQSLPSILALALVVGTVTCIASLARAQEDATLVPTENICYQGWHEVPSNMPGWTRCDPIPADTEQCEERTTFECTVPYGFIIGSHLMACGREVRIHSDRCAATHEVWAAHRAFGQVAAVWRDLSVNAETIAALRITLESATRTYEQAVDKRRRIFVETERELHTPTGGAGGGVRLIF